LALALSQRADYYLLDEPLGAQDSDSSNQILETIAELKKTKGLLVISHNQEALSPYFDRIISLA
jgi:putative ABC transport system permease protein